MAEKESVSQQLEGVIDTGAENFSVDLLTVAESGELEEKDTENNASDDDLSQDDDLINDDDLIDDDDDLEEKSETSADDDENDESGENDGIELDDDDDDSDKNYSKRVNKRIGKINNKRRIAETRVAEQDTEIQALNKRLDDFEDGKTSKDKPELKDYEEEEDYIEALSDWKAQQKIDAQTDKDAQDAAQYQQNEVEAKTKEHMDAGKKKYKNFNVTVKDLQLKRSILPFLNGLKNTPDVLFYLGKNLDKADDINDLIDDGKSIEAGSMLQKISSSIKPKKRSSAPNPINPGKGRGGGGIKKPEDMSNAEYRKYRDKQDKDKKAG